MFPSLQYIQADLDYRADRGRAPYSGTYPVPRPRRRFRLRRTHRAE